MCMACRGRRIAFRDVTFEADTFEVAAAQGGTEVRDLFRAVLDVDPDYLPGVSGGQVRLEDWLARKAPDWSRGVRTHTGELVGFVGVRVNSVLPDGSRVTRVPGASWEMGMLVVAPEFRRHSLAAALVRIAASVFGDQAWATARDDSPGSHLLAKSHWAPVGEFSWADGPTPGTAFRAPVTNR